MKLATASHSKIENFFRVYFKDSNLKLPAFHIHCGFWAKTLCRVFKINGITLGRHVFIDPVFVTRSLDGKINAPFELIVHESTHVLQYANEGFIGFLYSYLKEWFAFLRRQKKRDLETRWQAYYGIRHEEEARAAAEAYRSWRTESKQQKSG